MSGKEEIEKAKTAVKEAMIVTSTGIEPAVTDWLPTGCTVLDMSLTNSWPGGLPVGRFIQIYGASSTCKTVLGMTVLGYAQRKGGLAFFGDIEHTFDSKWAQLYGIDVTKPSFMLGYRKDGKFASPVTIEDFWDDYIPYIVEAKCDGPKVCVVDSLAALTDAAEQKSAIGDSSSYAAKAKQQSKGFRKYIDILARENITVIFLDQTRANITGYGAKEVVSGGEAIKFYCSTRIYLKHAAQVVNSKGIATGVEIAFTIVKNKASIPYREGKFRILFDYGLDDIWSNLSFMKLHTDGANSKTVTFNGETKQLANMISYVEKNNLENKLQQDVIELYKTVYKTSARKQRSW